ncbi:uncharacterized protein K452DRAFT_56082 [Aplosporella prunicola CBS 121167]|uniref:Uncharacterized protein n=1 Tax=Aplosporella prunicola CBS 121167 TaxID=1176127 RepID=A0A6A6B8V6_9PEZI|nr:uncharacterized protein K452DRAFT_56082 [Aplosporella prunicola CBS 121167]KAF2139793.1 hypothetical protein K452DRAFT_56082 [Aplosporella prunicola CBS 121167]
MNRDAFLPIFTASRQRANQMPALGIVGADCRRIVRFPTVVMRGVECRGVRGASGTGRGVGWWGIWMSQEHGQESSGAAVRRGRLALLPDAAGTRLWNASREAMSRGKNTLTSRHHPGRAAHSIYTPPTENIQPISITPPNLLSLPFVPPPTQIRQTGVELRSADIVGSGIFCWC